MTEMIHINYTQTHDMRMTRQYCPDCKKRSHFLNFYQEWYGLHSTCLRCGRQYGDNEWMPLEFCPHVRKDNIESAKSRWRKGLTRV